MKCPICSTQAQQQETRDYGERQQYDCPRCGRYTISRTAIAMLPSRFAESDKAFARLSHSVRKATSKEEWFFVSSYNLDELMHQPLPGIENQIENLCRWIAAKLEDDHFGQITLKDAGLLAGMIGTIDGKHVARLFQHMEEEQLIKRKNDKISLTQRGWDKIKSQPKAKTANIAGVHSVDHMSQPIDTPIIKTHCNYCGGIRNGYVKTHHSVTSQADETTFEDTYEIIECAGCSKLSVKRTEWFSEWETIGEDPVTGQPVLESNERYTYWPPKSIRAKPAWVEEISHKELRDILDEAYQAMNYGLAISAAIATRTALDWAMLESIPLM